MIVLRPNAALLNCCERLSTLSLQALWLAHSWIFIQTRKPRTLLLFYDGRLFEIERRATINITIRLRHFIDTLGHNTVQRCLQKKERISRRYCCCCFSTFPNNRGDRSKFLVATSTALSSYIGGELEPQLTMDLKMENTVGIECLWLR